MRTSPTICFGFVAMMYFYSAAGYADGVRDQVEVEYPHISMDQIQNRPLSSYKSKTYISSENKPGCKELDKTTFECRHIVDVGWEVERELDICGVFQHTNFLCTIYRTVEPSGPRNTLEVAAIGRAPMPAPLLSVGPLDLYPAALFTDSREIKSLGMETSETKLPAFDGVLGWVPINEVINGDFVLQQWEGLAQARTPFDCDERQCSILVFAWSQKAEQKIGGLASCRIARLMQKFSNPTRCAFVAINLGGKKMMVAVVGIQRRFAAYAGRDDFQIIVSPSDEKSFPSMTLLNFISAELKSYPFLLDVEAVSNRLVGSADPKFLNDIQMWTLQTIVISKSGFIYENAAHTAYPVATTLYVSPRNSLGSNEWRLPTSFTSSSYVNLVKAAILRAAQKLCPAARTENMGSFHFIFLRCG